MFASGGSELSPQGRWKRACFGLLWFAGRLDCSLCYAPELAMIRFRPLCVLPVAPRADLACSQGGQLESDIPIVGYHIARQTPRNLPRLDA